VFFFEHREWQGGIMGLTEIKQPGPGMISLPNPR